MISSTTARLLVMTSSRRYYCCHYSGNIKVGAKKARGVAAATSSNRITTNHQQQQQIRTHMNHGGGDNNSIRASAPIDSGPRHPVRLGLVCARATSNILRLLESSHSSIHHRCVDSLKIAYHEKGKIWTNQENKAQWTISSVFDNNDNNKEYDKQDQQEQEKQTIAQENTANKTTTTTTTAPSILFLTMSDDRTALAKILGSDGLERYVSLLRLDEAPTGDKDSITPSPSSSSMMPNDGWQIVREIVSSSSPSFGRSNNDNNKRGNKGNNNNNNKCTYESITKVLRKYLAIEHGGGENHMKDADTIFVDGSSLLSVGTLNPLESNSSELSDSNVWDGIVGSFVEISKEQYLDSTLQQIPHSVECSEYDTICNIDILTCQTAAAATIRVGNGNKTNLYIDHLILGKQQQKNNSENKEEDDDDDDDYDNDNDNNWYILSKTFSPHPWPA